MRSLIFGLLAALTLASQTSIEEILNELTANIKEATPEDALVLKEQMSELLMIREATNASIACNQRILVWAESKQDDELASIIQDENKYLIRTYAINESDIKDLLSQPIEELERARIGTCKPSFPEISLSNALKFMILALVVLVALFKR